MIEGRCPAPTGLYVTLLAATAKVAFVPIVLPMTRHAVCRQLVVVEIPGMAGVALDPCMRPSQGIFRRLVMIEVNRAPLVLVVAAFAFGAVAPGVNILNSVTIRALGADALVAFANMAP